MTIDFGNPGEVKFTMNQYITNLITECPDDLTTGVSSTPASAHLFQVNDMADNLLPKLKLTTISQQNSYTYASTHDPTYRWLWHS